MLSVAHVPVNTWLHSFIHKLHVGGRSSFFHVPSLGREYILWGHRVHTAVSFFLLRKRRLCGEAPLVEWMGEHVSFLSYACSEPHCSSCHLVITSQVSSCLQNLWLPIQPIGNHWSRTQSRSSQQTFLSVWSMDIHIYFLKLFPFRNISRPHRLSKTAI